MTERADIPSWAELFEQHAAAMRVSVSAIIQGNADQGDPTTAGTSADDVVSDVFRELIDKGDSLPAGSERSFLCRRARDRAIDRIRATSIRRRHELAGRADERTDLGTEETVIDQFDAAAIIDALDRLPDRERSVVEERVLLGRPAKDVAAELGVAPQYISQIVKATCDKIRTDPTFTTAVADGHLEVDDSNGGEQNHGG